MQVDESGADDQSRRIDHRCALEGLRRNPGDAISNDPDTSDRVESCLRIDHSAAVDDEIVLLRP